MKYVLLLTVAGFAVIGGYFYFTQEGGLETATASGEVTAVSLEQMAVDGPALITIQTEAGNSEVIAVPSMGLPLCAAQENIADVSTIAVGDMAEVSGLRNEEGNIIPCEDEAHYLRVTGKAMDAAYGFEFEYRKGPNGYVTIEDTESTEETYVTGMILFNKAQYEELQQSTEPREGPPAIHMRVYSNDDNMQAANWVDEYPRESNIELALEDPREVVVGGANAVLYTTDGLYPTTVYVVASGEHMYVLMGSYNSTDDPIYADFQALVDSFSFIQAKDAMQSKIDPQVACESALAYMTFASGDDADAFVAACVRGEHPEVIERYIEDMGLDGAAI